MLLSAILLQFSSRTPSFCLLGSKILKSLLTLAYLPHPICLEVSLLPFWKYNQNSATSHYLYCHQLIKIFLALQLLSGNFHLNHWKPEGVMSWLNVHVLDKEGACWGIEVASRWLMEWLTLPWCYCTQKDQSYFRAVSAVDFCRLRFDQTKSSLTSLVVWVSLSRASLPAWCWKKPGNKWEILTGCLCSSVLSHPLFLGNHSICGRIHSHTHVHTNVHCLQWDHPPPKVPFHWPNPSWRILLGNAFV